jgi:ABC-type Mn2+/Zn2+ transport system permease subunit
LFLVGITIGVSIKIVGALLIDAIVLFPALAAMRIGNSLRSTLIYSSIFGVITTVGGFLVALLFDLPTGASISAMGVIALCFTYVVRR